MLEQLHNSDMYFILHVCFALGITAAYAYLATNYFKLKTRVENLEKKQGRIEVDVGTIASDSEANKKTPWGPLS